MKKLLEAKNVKVHFKQRGGFLTANKTIYAVDNVSFDVYDGEVLGIVGESGCGKSTLARALVGLNQVSSGSLIFNGEDLGKVSSRRWHELRQQIQFIFQDPVASLNNRMTVAEIIAEPLKIYQPALSKSEVIEKVIAVMKLVGLSADQINRYPQEFSGGQCQRIGIARAIILQPKLLICDEAVSALDVSIKAQVINLLKDLQQKLQLTVLFVSHDLSVIKHICDRVLVMYLGNIMELAPKKIIFNNSHNPYTRALLSAIPIANPDALKESNAYLRDGELPSPANPPVGCVFNTRCALVGDECLKSRPPLRAITADAQVACFKAERL